MTLTVPPLQLVAQVAADPVLRAHRTAGSMPHPAGLR